MIYPKNIKWLVLLWRVEKSKSLEKKLVKKWNINQNQKEFEDEEYKKYLTTY